jgi:cytochrome c553
MRRWFSALPLSAGCWLLCLTPSAAPAADARPQAAEEFFEKSVRPLLAANCFECHGPDKKRGGLRLDSRAAALKGGDTGPALVPGKPEESRLIAALSHKDKLKMPPENPLSPKQIEVLTTWIRQGAVWPDSADKVRVTPGDNGFTISAKDRAFWSFQPIADPALPRVHDADWVKTDVDRFVLARLEAEKLRPSAPADKRTLLRRATFDLTGLPPTPDEIDAFMKDESPDAFAKVVDRLLVSPAYGERWARHWLDIARYGEDQAHTFQARKYPYGWRYRDWVVKAFNDDLPYDRFVKEQIAADLLDLPERKENLPALGFFALGPVYYGDAKKLDQYDDRIDTLCRGVLGLTVACARCHDHKFDPISSKDYYALAGVVAGTEYVEVPFGPPRQGPPAPPDDNKKKPEPPRGPIIHALKDGPQPVDFRVHIRGNPDNLGAEAPRRFLAILSGEGKRFTKGSGRLELAEAVAGKDNPLTARVIVNRLWQHHFGTGLVRTTSNFGALGERPTHPELLDHLATHLIKSGWSLKALHREMMLSATYQQDSRADKARYEVDPENKLLWRVSRRRLEVEAWRDAMLAASGNLDRTLGGPSLDLASPDNRRRTLYGAVSRHDLNALLRLFDFPDPNLTVGERPTTTVPLQQLFVLNSEFMARNARALAARLAAADRDDEARIRRAFLLLYARSPSERELKLGLDFLALKDDAAAAKLSRWEQYAQVLLSANEFMYVD